MTSRSLLTALFFLTLAPLAACGGNVNSSTGNSGGAGGGGATSSGGTGGAPTTSSSGGTGGSGGIVIGTGGAGQCGAFDQMGCLNNFPSCVPVYDDTCCPSCDEGPCADCTSLAFHHCASHDEGCSADKPSCGVVPDWACAGGQAKCDIDPGGSPVPCATVAGCVAGYCNLDIDCTTDPVCVAVTAGICGPVLCDAIPPPCPEGTTNEIKDGCYTSLCVPGSLCKPTL